MRLYIRVQYVSGYPKYPSIRTLQSEKPLRRRVPGEFRRFAKGEERPRLPPTSMHGGMSETRLGSPIQTRAGNFSPGAPASRLPFMPRSPRAARVQVQPERVTPRKWEGMSVAQQSALHKLGFTPLSWQSRFEAASRGQQWQELSDAQREAAMVLGWDEQSWELRWGQAPPSDGIVWKPPPKHRSPRVSKLEAIKFPNHQKTHGIFQEPSYLTINDPYRARAEVVERRRVVATSGVIDEAVMSRARGKGFETMSPRKGRLEDAYFSTDQYMADEGQQKQRELTLHAMASYTDRTHGGFGMSSDQHLSRKPLHSTGSGHPKLPIFHYAHANRTHRTYYSPAV